MSSRGVVGVHVNGVDKLTYNHFDSYPSGLGDDLVEMIRGWFKQPHQARVKSKLGMLKRKAEEVVLVSEGTTPTVEQQAAFAKFSNTGVGNQSLSDWYCLLRDLQGNLQGMLDAGVMLDASEFVKDSLFCEWGYVINFDTEKFEVYKGFQEQPHDKGRFAQLPLKPKSYPEQSEYYPIALIAEFPLKRIPKNWIEKVDPSEEEDA